MTGYYKVVFKILPCPAPPRPEVEVQWIRADSQSVVFLHLHRARGTGRGERKVRWVERKREQSSSPLPHSLRSLLTLHHVLYKDDWGLVRISGKTLEWSVRNKAKEPVRWMARGAKYITLWRKAYEEREKSEIGRHFPVNSGRPLLIN